MPSVNTPHRLALLGGGLRGIRLARQATGEPTRATLVAVAEPVSTRLKQCKDIFGLPEDRCFRDHKELLAEVRDLDAAIVATTVSTHCEVACDCMEQGVAIFLEKPIAGTIGEAQRIVETAERTRVPVFMGFNCRYSPFFRKVRDVAVSGALGRILAINWTEGIPASMWAEDYCRGGNYNRSAVIGSLLLEKCCHDIDLINWVVGVPCARVAAFGSRRFYVPRGEVPERCSTDCPEHETCPFYVPEKKAYGRVTAEESNVCVFHTGSDLVDRFRSIYEYEDGTVVNLNVEPVWAPPGRFLYICGTRASLAASSAENRISVRDLLTDDEKVYHPRAPAGGHGGADELCVQHFLDWLDTPTLTPRATVRDGLETVLMACAAETARKEHRVVELAPLRQPEPLKS